MATSDAASESKRPSVRNVITKRHWDTIKNDWLRHVKSFQSPGAPPDPPTVLLLSQRAIEFPKGTDRGPVADVAGFRWSLLHEAIYMFHKCAHSHLATQRIGGRGMTSWSMFNAYHSAFIGARGIMSLLGISFPILTPGGQFVFDAYPPPGSRNVEKAMAAGTWKHETSFVVRFGKEISHVELWEAFGRILIQSNVPRWVGRSEYQELRDLSMAEVPKARHGYLYKPTFWPLPDLLIDATEAEFVSLIGNALDSDAKGFLLRLSCNVYRLFEGLMDDLSEGSVDIKQELAVSRIRASPEHADLASYNAFIAGLSSEATA